MHHQCYAIFDRKSQVFNTPFFYRHVADCLRNIAQVIVDPKNALCQFAEEYDLYLLFSVDDETGKGIEPQTGAPQFTINLGMFKQDILKKGEQHESRPHQSQSGASQPGGPVNDSATSRG